MNEPIPPLRPGLVDRTFRFFDIDQGWMDYTDACVRAARQSDPDLFADLRPDYSAGLLADGFTTVPALGPDACAREIARLDAHGGAVPTNSLTLSETAATLDEVMNPAMVALLHTYFRSHFMVFFYHMESTGPQTDNVSLRWHCDTGPRRHLKAFVYLTGPETHDAGTLIFDRETTRRFMDAGYPFGPVEERVRDIHPFAERYRIPGTPTKVSPPAGHAAVFEPANVLHRGDPPSRGTRYYIQIGLVPSPQPWREMLTANFDLIRQNSQPIFPKVRT